MGLFSRKKQAAAPAKRKYAPNPHLHSRSAGFSSSNTARLLGGWETTSHTIDFYLQQELRELRARSRKMVRANPYGKRFISTIKANVVGPQGVGVQSQSMMRGQLDTPANAAIESAFKDWGSKNCDKHGRLTWIDMQNLAITSAAQDGEFLIRLWRSGRNGLQLEIVDPELLDVEKNTTVKGGGEIRLGVQYNSSGKRTRYHFKRKSHPVHGGYDNYDRYSLPANEFIHGFINEWPDQSRGTPWMHASLERSKHLEKYEEAAIVKARSTAATMAVLRSPPGDQAYEGDDEYGDGVTLDQYEAGTIKDIGDREITNIDSDYPHQMYSAFVKAHLQGIASGLGISYHSLSGDLEGVNYSSIRAGVLEDREVFKGLQNWFIRSLVQPVFEDWLSMSLMHGVIRIGTRPLARPTEEYMAAHYQGRRWSWVDPQKDGAANKLAIDNNLKSRSQIMREQGDDPESVFLEIKSERELMDRLGIKTAEQEALENADTN